MLVPPFIRWACIGNPATIRHLGSSRQPLIGTLAPSSPRQRNSDSGCVL